MAILGKKIWNSKERMVEWEYLMEQYHFDSLKHLIQSSVSKLTPKSALLLRIQILLYTYNGDYHTDAFDMKRLVNAVESNFEKIFFWGADKDIERAKLILGSSQENVEEQLLIANPILGTATLLESSKAKNGQLYELTRTGSISKSIHSTIANIKELIELFKEESTKKYNNQIVFSTPRNRTSNLEIRGGAAIQRQHVRELNSTFWGWAPWYTMQGDFLEILDYREIYKKPEHFIKWLNHLSTLYFYDADNVEFTLKMFRLNLSDNCKIPDCKIQPIKDLNNYLWESTKVKSKSLIPFNPIFISKAINEKEGFPLESLIEDAALANPACTCVELNLQDKNNVIIQEYLIKQKWVFVGLRFYPSLNDYDQFEVKGSWVKIRKGSKLAKPYYLNMKGFNEEEEILLIHLRSVWNLLLEGAEK